MLNISEIIFTTEALFDLSTSTIYNNELQRPAITESPDGGHGVYGWCSGYEIWQETAIHLEKESPLNCYLYPVCVIINVMFILRANMGAYKWRFLIISTVLSRMISRKP